MKQLITPWLATFLFGCGVFVVGKIFQRAEKRRLAEKKAAIERENTVAKTMEQMQRREQKPDMGIMEAIRGQGQQHIN